jgi:hypothetical protein
MLCETAYDGVSPDVHHVLLVWYQHRWRGQVPVEHAFHELIKRLSTSDQVVHV